MLEPHVAEDNKSIGNWLFNKFYYSVVVVVVFCGVEYKIENKIVD